MDDFKEQIKKSFHNCRTDIETLKVENIELKEKISYFTDEIIELKSQLKGFKIALDYIKELNINSQTESKPQIFEQQLQKSVQKVSPATNIVKNDPYEALLAFKAKSNKREILKQKLMSIISVNGINLSELKFLFVDHYRYCSKATFYNYLKELELERIIQMNRENSKNFVYLANSISREI